jgi:hypothetical protein
VLLTWPFAERVAVFVLMRTLSLNLGLDPPKTKVLGGRFRKMRCLNLHRPKTQKFMANFYQNYIGFLKKSLWAHNSPMTLKR